MKTTTTTQTFRTSDGGEITITATHRAHTETELTDWGLSYTVYLIPNAAPDGRVSIEIELD
jgi:hypothetical protein